MGVSKSQTVVWAGLLFVGFNLLGVLIFWLVPEKFGYTWNRGLVRLWEVPNVSFAIPFALLVTSYFFVRRQDHHMLSHLWPYTIVVGAIGVISAPVLASLDSASTLGWWAAAFALGGFILLVWFARRISALSFRHSLLFIGLTIAVPSPASFIPPLLPTDPSIAPSLPIYIHITLLVGGVLMGGLAVWALANIRIVVSTTRAVLPRVMAIMLLAAALITLGAAYTVEPVRVLDWVVPMLTAGTSSLIASTLAVVITYVFRVRRRTGPEL